MSGIETVLADSLTWTAASTVLDEKDATDIFAALVSQNDGLTQLSNQFLQSGIDSYTKAVELDDSAENRYSYGEALLKIEDYEAAEEAFNKVKTTYPDSTAGDYGLGKMYLLTEAYEKAIEEFEAALEIDPEFYDAMAEIGYAYTDMGEYEAAEDIVDELEDLDEDLAGTLEDYIYQSKEPEIAFAWTTSTFPDNSETSI